MNKENIIIGTELKININIDPIEDLTMDEYDFKAVFYSHSSRQKEIKKEEMIRIDKNNYVALVDSTNLGAGELRCKIIAYLPDDDFPDNTRTEVVCIDTGINIIKAI
jgi:hypothetical protein